MTMYRKSNFWPLPKAPGACAIHVSNSHTKSRWISEKIFFDPNPPRYPQVQPLGMTELNEYPVWYVIYLSFVRRYTKFGLKIFEIDFYNSYIMIFDLFAPSQGPSGRGTKKLCRCMCIHVSNLHTKSGWISEKNYSPTPHGTPKSHPWRMTQATKWKSHLICFLSFLCEKTHKVWFKIFEIDFVIEI